MSKPSFLICTNPIENDAYYILHMGNDKCLIELNELDNIEGIECNESFQIISHKTPNNELKHFSLGTTSLLGELTPTCNQAILKEAEIWFRELLRFEDTGEALEPYCAELPDLFIEHALITNQWFCTYDNEKYGFELDDDMWDFILHDLQLILPEEGVVNEY